MRTPADHADVRRLVLFFIIPAYIADALYMQPDHREAHTRKGGRMGVRHRPMRTKTFEVVVQGTQRDKE